MISIMMASGFSTSAMADERESLEQLKATTTNLIELLVKEGVLPKAKADALVKKATEDAKQQVLIAKQKEKAEQPEVVKENTVRVQYVPEHVKRQMRAELKEELMADLNYKAGERLGIPTWIDRISFYGDMRLRDENNNFDAQNEDAAILSANTTRAMNVNNSTEDRNRLRLRARLGADIKVNDWLEGGVRLVTGEQGSPVSPNQTEGMSQGKYTFAVDRAFLRLQPNSWLKVEGGRFSNPFFYTDLLWDPDLAFDGVQATFSPKINNRLSSFTTVGAFPIEEIETSKANLSQDKWLYSAQTGIKWQATDKTDIKLAVAYHDFKNAEGKLNSVGLTDYSSTQPQFRQRGNNTFNINANNTTSATIYGLASKFELVNIIGQIDYKLFSDVRMTLTGDYVKNVGFNQQEIRARTGRTYKDETEAYQVRLDVGNNNFTSNMMQSIKQQDWQASFGYKYLEADSVLDAFTDSDFRLGGTDAKGWYLMGNYGVDKNAWVSARYLTADTISGSPYSVDVFMLDLNARF